MLDQTYPAIPIYSFLYHIQSRCDIMILQAGIIHSIFDTNHWVYISSTSSMLRSDSDSPRIYRKAWLIAWYSLFPLASLLHYTLVLESSWLISIQLSTSHPVGVSHAKCFPHVTNVIFVNTWHTNFTRLHLPTDCKFTFTPFTFTCKGSFTEP